MRPREVVSYLLFQTPTALSQPPCRRIRVHPSLPVRPPMWYCSQAPISRLSSEQTKRIPSRATRQGRRTIAPSTPERSSRYPRMKMTTPSLAEPLSHHPSYKRGLSNLKECVLPVIVSKSATEQITQENARITRENEEIKKQRTMVNPT